MKAAAKFTVREAIRPRWSPARHSRVLRALAAVAAKFPLPILLGGVVVTVFAVWTVFLLCRYTDRTIAKQTPEAAAEHTVWGGELTLAEIRAGLLDKDEHAVGLAPEAGHLSLLAYAIWPLQFRPIRDVLGVVAVLGFVNLVAMFAIWWERKVAARIQSRLGPMRVGGWHGWAQSLADGIKLIQKEDIIPADADRLLFRLSPYLVFVPIFVAFIALPFGFGWVVRDMDVALLFVLAMVGIDVVGVILAGWASNNKWSLLGAMREACQMVSYEIPMGMALLLPVMTVGSLSLSVVGGAKTQGGGFHTWLIFANPFIFVAAFVYFIASLAACKRAPFDLPEAESELVAGFHTEYSGFRWALFFFGEYAAMFIVSGLAVILFLGSWHSPLPGSWVADWEYGNMVERTLHGLLFSGPLWFIAKAFFLIYVQMWLRWTLPRLRIDQVLYTCVQVLLPLTMVLLLGNALWLVLVPADGVLARIANLMLTLVGAVLVAGFVTIMFYGLRNRRRLVGELAVDHLPGA